MNPPKPATAARRAGWLFLFCLTSLGMALFVMAILQGNHRQRTRGIGLPLPDPIYGASVHPLCVNVTLQRYLTTSEPFLEETLDRIDAAGFASVRQTFPWVDIEPAPGVYDWAPWDALIQAVADHPARLKLIAVLDTAPAWATGNVAGQWHAAPPANPADLARFARAFAARYGDRIDVYQIWDEPNLSSHWGGRDVDPSGYVAMLKASAEALRSADSDGEATILLAGLAPTVESGPRNLSEVRYLDALYDLGAAPYFDIVSGKPYGFDTGPDDLRVDESVLNYSRLILLRETMVAHGDADKAVWASHWGWNALPPGWEGRTSIWGRTDALKQATRTIAALQRARREWPWVGALCLENWQPDAPPDDARWGFALISQDDAARPIYRAIEQWADANTPATNHPGYHSAVDIPGQLLQASTADYTGEWRFSELGADVTPAGGQVVTIPFEGTDFGLRVRRGNYRAYFFVTIDGQAANDLPTAEEGAYLVLSSPDDQLQIKTVPVARGLDDGPHLARVAVERGWGQSPLLGWSVGWWPHAAERAHRRWMAGLGLIALTSGVALLWTGRLLDWRWLARALATAWKGLSDAATILVTGALTVVFWASAWLTWGQERAAGAGGLIATIASASLFYVSPIFVLSLLSLLLLGALILLRLDLGLALIAFAAPFYLQSREMFVRALSIVEIAVILCALSWLVHQVSRIRPRSRQNATHQTQSVGRRHLSSLDWGVLFFVTVSFASLFIAEVPGVARREFRVVILEPALFYLMLRTTPLDRRARWRLVDAFVLGAVGVALVGLYQYLFTQDIITAEAGLRRIKSVYGSPNNVGLYLGRALPVLVAVVIVGRNRGRRWSYGLGALLVAPALLLSFSKGALLFGVPASLLAIGLLAGGRWLWAAVGALGAAALGAIPVLRTPRFTSALDLQSGTSFFRLNLWRSTVDMIRDHPLFGVGLDNFLYAYRGRYIRPAAWQEPDLSHPHNVVLDYWSRLGLLGLAAGLWLQAAFWRLALPLRRLSDPDDRALAIGVMASMADSVAHGLVDNSYFLVDLAFVFFLSLALTVHLNSIKKPDDNG